MNTDSKAIVGLILLGSAAIGLAFSNAYDKQAVEEEAVEVVEEYTPSPGTFHCEYYKAKTQVVEDVYDHYVVHVSNGWNWVLTMHDGTTLYYTQTAGQFCYVAGDSDED